MPKEEEMARKILYLMLTAILLFAFANPAGAISYGEFDGTTHSNVGSIVLRTSAGNLYQFCSGTLIGAKVFLTAAHCTYPLDGIVASVPGVQVLVTFDQTITKGGTFYTGEWITNPNYNNYSGQYGNADPGDIAVILLDQVPSGISPARLPAAGLLDQLKDQHILNETPFTAVGYGSVREIKQTGWQAIDATNMDRNRADQLPLSLTNAWITLSMNFARGNGGTCYGDSGGPHFIHLDGADNIVAAITVSGDAQCKATDKDYRLDTVPARSFLEPYVKLP